MVNTWLFLDFDNTLMATEQYAVPSLITRFNELYGSQIDKALTYTEFKQYFHGQARETLCKNLSKYFHIKVDYSTLYDKREFRIMKHLQQLPEGVPMAPGLISTLSILASQNIKFALVTNNSIQRAFAAMRFADNQQGETLAQFFGTHFFEAGSIQKPQPDVYLHAMQQVKADSDHSFAVEDSLIGVKSAISAGLRTIGFTGFADNPDDMKSMLLNEGCIATFHCWSEFTSVIGSF